jgi:hypothetical protein
MNIEVACDDEFMRRSSNDRDESSKVLEKLRKRGSISRFRSRLRRPIDIVERKI